MPGHKRNKAFGITGSEIDITEIPGFDNLHAPCGAIKEIENALMGFYGSKRSFLSVGGSSLGIIAAVFALCRPGDEILVAENCHKSVFYACELRGLKAHYIRAEYIDELGIFGAVNQASLDFAVSKHPGAAAAVITSPTYEGIVSKVSCQIPLITDAAHGAHFPFGNFPEYPKSEIVISSLHKTLPCLTQTAVINVYDGALAAKTAKYIDMLETTSPSYVLMNSASVCCEYLKDAADDFHMLDLALDRLYKTKLEKLEFKIFDDKSRIVISCRKANITGAALADILRREYKIECEYHSVNYINLIATVADAGAPFARLADALLKIDKSLEKRPPRRLPKLPQRSAPAGEADIEKCTKTPLCAAAGKISAELISAYPPGAPIITAGQVFTDEIIEYIMQLKKFGVNISSASGFDNATVLTKDE